FVHPGMPDKSPMGSSIVSGGQRAMMPAGYGFMKVSAFPGIAISQAAQSSTPSKAGIPKDRIPACFRCSTCQAKSRKLLTLIHKLCAVIHNLCKTFFRKFFATRNPCSLAGAQEYDCTSPGEVRPRSGSRRARDVGLI